MTRAGKDAPSRRLRLRQQLGGVLHTTGLRRLPLEYESVLPRAVTRRLRSYLASYYGAHPDRAEGWMQLPGLRARVWCDLADHMVSPVLDAQGLPHEWKEIQHFARHRRRGDVLFDVGANHGIWGFALASTEPDCRCFLFEAMPKLAARLRASAARNRGLDVQAVECAVGDKDDAPLDFYVPLDRESGLGSTVLGEVQQRVGHLDPSRKITVLSRTLDGFVAEHRIERLDLVKIDVEGAEDAVLRGAETTLRTLRPRLVMIETSTDSWATARMLELGYRAYRLGPDGEPLSLAEDPFWGNVFFST